MRLSEDPLIPAETIHRRVGELAQAISTACDGQELCVIAVLRGGVIFAADLVRRLSVDVVLDFIRAKSYAGAASTGQVEFLDLPDEPVTGKHVLVVEDILDTGRTAQAIVEYLGRQEPASLAVCTLLDKPARRKVPFHADFVGFTIDDHFVVGYGLDLDEQFRHLPDIRTIESL